MRQEGVRSSDGEDDRLSFDCYCTCRVPFLEHCRGSSDLCLGRQFVLGWAIHGRQRDVPKLDTLQFTARLCMPLYGPSETSATGVHAVVHSSACSLCRPGAVPTRRHFESPVGVVLLLSSLHSSSAAPRQIAPSNTGTTRRSPLRPRFRCDPLNFSLLQVRHLLYERDAAGMNFLMHSVACSHCPHPPAPRGEKKTTPPALSARPKASKKKASFLIVKFGLDLWSGEEHPDWSPRCPARKIVLLLYRCGRERGTLPLCCPILSGVDRRYPHRGAFCPASAGAG